MRYYFDIGGNGPETRDIEGLECKSVEEMHRRATMILAQVALDVNHADCLNLRTIVRDSRGRAVYEARLSVEGRILS